MLFCKNKNFCDINPLCFAISEKKEIVKRHFKNILSDQNMAKEMKEIKLPNLISSNLCPLIKKGKDIDPVLQENKVVNIEIACRTINGIIIHPNEVFSFWRTVGKITKKKGYKDGRVLVQNKLKPGIGGGLCNLGNTINRLVLHSPLEILEFHTHSDALSPDHGQRIPLNAGTSVSYNYIDYRFRNNTNQDIQLCVWCENKYLYGELRSETSFPWTYELVEENHHFQKEGDKYYRVSQIYRLTREKSTEKIIKKELILNNHSMVMYDPNLIPKGQIYLK